LPSRQNRIGKTPKRQNVTTTKATKDARLIMGIARYLSALTLLGALLTTALGGVVMVG